MSLYLNVEIDLDLAVFLATVCVQAYNQFDNPSEFTVPTGYNLIKSFSATALDKTELFGFIIESPDNIVIAFRGTDSDSDTISDLEFLQIPFFPVPNSGKTHAGFTFIYLTCREQIIKVLQDLPISKPLYITGHSLGAALATLNTLDVAANTGFQPVMYNYASPRVGDPNFAKTYNAMLKSSVRVSNIYDVIPLLPPEKITIPFTERVLYFSHVQKKFPIAAQTGSLSGNHALETYINALK